MHALNNVDFGKCEVCPKRPDCDILRANDPSQPREVRSGSAAKVLWLALNELLSNMGSFEEVDVSAQMAPKIEALNERLLAGGANDEPPEVRRLVSACERMTGIFRKSFDQGTHVLDEDLISDMLDVAQEAVSEVPPPPPLPVDLGDLLNLFGAA